jgi:hypothetical protein
MVVVPYRPAALQGGGIDSLDSMPETVFVNVYGAQESISPTYVAWRASTTNRVAYRPARAENR